MENLSETCRSWTDLAFSSTNRNPCLIHIYPTGQGMGRRHALGSRPLTIGRSNECDIFINDNSVSRRHVCIEFRGDAYYAIDAIADAQGIAVFQLALRARHVIDEGCVHALKIELISGNATDVGAGGVGQN